MFIWELISWWYGAGWQELRVGIIRRIKRTYLGFSVPILIRTMFEPWRRIISTDSENIMAKFRSLIDNLVSRAVGFVVRLLALMAAGILILGTAIGGAILFVVWPLTPFIGIALILWGIIK